MTLGSSKYGFETHHDRQRREQMEQWKARATEARVKADELEAEYLAKELDPIIQDILADLLSAVEKTDSAIRWDGKTTWRINDENTPADEWLVRLDLRVSEEGMRFRIESDDVLGAREYINGVPEATERLGRLKEVLEKIARLPVRLKRPDVSDLLAEDR